MIGMVEKTEYRDYREKNQDVNERLEKPMEAYPVNLEPPTDEEFETMPVWTDNSAVKIEDIKPYMITYENGATHFIQSQSLIDAIQESKEALMSCVSKGFDQNNFARPVKAEQVNDFDPCKKIDDKENTLINKEINPLSGKNV